MEEHDKPTAWDRPYFRAGGGDATVLYAVFGDFRQPLHLDAAAYRSYGIPEGVRLTTHRRAEEPEYIASLSEGWVGERLRTDEPGLYAAVESVPHCLLLRGRIVDPETLDYLRDIVGVLTALLDGGGAALLDWQALAWFSPERWRERMFTPNAPVPRNHVTILVTPEGEGDQVWVHTRGMRKFGRPDLSIPHVAPERQRGYIELCNRFIPRLAFGGQVPEGQAIRMQGLPEGLTCHYGGDYDDPDFNNVHIEIRMP